MPDLPLVSVIIPLYNAERYIEECIKSVSAQTWPNIEIIIVDDGSTDDSLAVIKKLGSRKVKVFTQLNSGASMARNYGLQQAKGDFIQFMDADDLLSINKIEAQLKVLENYTDHLAVCDTVHFKDGEDPYGKPRIKEWFTAGAANGLDFLIKLYGGFGPPYGGMIQPNAWLTPRKIIDKAGLWNPMRCPDDDGEFFCRVLLASEGVRYADGGVNYYRKFIGKPSLSSRRTYESRYSILQSWILKSEHLKPYENVPGVIRALASNFTELCYSYYSESPQLSRIACDWAVRYGGLTHPPKFGNRFFNKFRGLLPWKMALSFQKIYQGLKAN